MMAVPVACIRSLLDQKSVDVRFEVVSASVFAPQSDNIVSAGAGFFSATSGWCVVEHGVIWQGFAMMMPLTNGFSL